MKLNPQVEHEIDNCILALRQGNYIIFPGETGWAIGCDATRTDLVEKICADSSMNFPAVLLDHTGRLNKYVKQIPDQIWDLVEYSSRPLHIRLTGILNLPAIISEEKNEADFRIVKDEFSSRMMHKFGKPVFTALIAETPVPGTKNLSILNTACYVVNLRIAAGSNPESLVIIRLFPGGRIEIIKK